MMNVGTHFPFASRTVSKLTGRWARRIYLAILFLLLIISTATRLRSYFMARKIEAVLHGLGEIHLDAIAGMIAPHAINGRQHPAGIGMRENRRQPPERARFPRIVDKIDFPKPVDLSALSWTDAFAALHNTLIREYPFTAWRRIDWPGLYDNYRARVVDAEQHKNVDAFRHAVRGYVYSIPDGHMYVHGPFDDLRRREIGGGFGFAVAPLDDGRVVCFLVVDGSPAAKAGLTPGAEISSLGGKSIEDAALAVSTLWTRKPVSTSIQRRMEQFRYLSRAPVGTSVEIAFRKRSENAITKIIVTAADDHYEYLQRSQPPGPVQEQRRLLTHKVLDSGLGYIAVFGEDPEIVTEFENVLREMIDRKVPALILDIRQNPGGEDETAARIVSYFHNQKSLYEYAQYFNTDTGTFDVLRSGTLYVTPRQPHFAGPVIALIGSNTGSSGEGIAMEIARAPHGQTLGFDGTAGYFGMSGGSAKLPEQVVVGFPIGTSLGKRGWIQIDSDYRGTGGVLPQIRVPRTYENVLAVGRGEDVELQAAEQELLKAISKKKGLARKPVSSEGLKSR
jgi:carboxyl-terminal processing protease